MPFVYFIQEGEDGPIKIGFSSNPRERMIYLQTSHAQQLCLVGVIRCNNIEAERSLHRLFVRARIRGEWYRQNFSIP